MFKSGKHCRSEYLQGYIFVFFIIPFWFPLEKETTLFFFLLLQFPLMEEELETDVFQRPQVGINHIIHKFKISKRMD